jgi:putative copper resistance protein D
MVQVFREKLRAILLIGLVLAILSGAVWLIALAIDIGGQGAVAVVSNRTVWLLLTSTQFGHVWLARFVLATFLVGLAWLERQRVAAVSWGESFFAISAACLMGSIAWAGHAAASPGVEGDVHLVADVLHLVAAGAWLGGLLPLWLLFRLAMGEADESLVSAAQIATHRFSMLGMLAVGTLIATGLVNAWELVGTLRGLFGTDYGRLLLLKIALFVAMIGIACANRFRLTPRLPRKDIMNRLAGNILVELGLGLAIIVIVSALGVLPPAAHAGMQMH